MSAIIELTQGKVALVSSADLPLVEKMKWRWSGAAPVSGTGKTQVTLGRYILGAVGSAKVYYKDGDACNCVRRNLTRVYNEQNKRK